MKQIIIGLLLVIFFDPIWALEYDCNGPKIPFNDARILHSDCDHAAQEARRDLAYLLDHTSYTTSSKLTWSRKGGLPQKGEMKLPRHFEWSRCQISIDVPLHPSGDEFSIRDIYTDMIYVNRMCVQRYGWQMGAATTGRYGRTHVKVARLTAGPHLDRNGVWQSNTTIPAGLVANLSTLENTARSL